LPRLYRQAPLNSIWEGSGNVQCLDVLRALSREPQARAALQLELQQAAGIDAGYDAALQAANVRLANATLQEADARRVSAALATLLQASVLLRAGSPVAQAFVRSRLCSPQLVYGMLDADAPLADILVRAAPASA